MLLLITALILLLYLRTLNYNYVIDDYVKRDGYLYDIPMEGPSHVFWSKKPSPQYRLFMIGLHCVNSAIVYLLWGWAPALLFAVHPLSVWGTAWVTGNYYATTAYFCLISYYLIHTFPNVWGAVVALPFYAAALNSTITAMAFPFLMMFYGLPGMIMLLPLAMFVFGKRFKTGMKIRSEFCFPTNVKVDFKPSRVILMTKVMARYIYDIFVPVRLGFFPKFGKDIRNSKEYYDQMHKVDAEFWSALALCGTVFGAGLMINPFATLWFFVLMGLHSQFKIMGQFYAQRYAYLPMIGLCVITGSVMQNHPIVLTAMATFLIVRTHLFIPAWRNMETLWRNDLDMFPDNALAYSNLAQFLIEKKDHRQYHIYEIGSLLMKAYAIEPGSYEVHMNLAAYYYLVNNIEFAIAHTKKALELVTAIGITNRVIDLTEQLKRLNKIKDERATISRSNQGGIENGKRTEEATAGSCV